MALKDILAPVHAILLGNGSLPPDRLLEIAAMPKRDRLPGPRVTWVPGQDAFVMQAPSMSKSVQQAFFAANPGKQIPRSLTTRLVGIEAHLWAGTQVGAADDYSAAEDLLGRVVSALRHVAFGAYELLPSGWVNPRSSEGNLLGHRYILNLHMFVPVLEVQDNPIPLPGESTTIVAVTPQTMQMGPIPPSGSTVTNP